jgi:hypothetical protein
MGIETALLIASIASTAATVYTQDQTAKATNAANQRTYDNQMIAYNANIANANWSKTQEADNLSAAKIENNAQARREMAKATTAAGEAGVSGLSVDSLLAELGGNAGRANANAEVQYLRRDRAIEMDRTNAWASTASAINSLKTPQGADYIGAGLKIANATNDYFNPRVSDARTKRIS